MAEIELDPPITEQAFPQIDEVKRLKEHFRMYGKGFSAEPESKEDIRQSMLSNIGYRIYLPKRITK